MKWIGSKNQGMVLLGAWLVLTGFTSFVPVAFIDMGFVLSALAIVAGVYILLGR